MGGKYCESKMTNQKMKTFSKYKEEFTERFEEQIKQLKVVLSHVGLYVGLIIYTALGAWVSF